MDTQLQHLPDPPHSVIEDNISDNVCDCDCDCACELDSATVRPAVPLTYYLELTPTCNNRCPGCGNTFIANTAARTATISTPPLDAHAWTTILRNLPPQTLRFSVTGGEPTTHPGFATIIHAIAARQTPFTLFTNGRWAHPDRLITLLRGSNVCRGLLISLHGATAAAHETFSGVPGSFGETCDNIQRAVQAQLTVAISTVFTGTNVEQIDAVVALARQFGVRQIVFNRYLGTAQPEIAVSTAQLRTAVEHVEELRQAGHPVKFGATIPACFADSSASGCSAGRTFLTIDPWGNMRPCNHVSLTVGNICQQPIEEIWHSPELARWNEGYATQCHHCHKFTFCKGGCRAMALLCEHGRDPLMGQPYIS